MKAQQTQNGKILVPMPAVMELDGAIYKGDGMAWVDRTEQAEPPLTGQDVTEATIAAMLDNPQDAPAIAKFASDPANIRDLVGSAG
jgi:hypothetical protein